MEWGKAEGPPCPALDWQVCRVQRKFWIRNLTPSKPSDMVSDIPLCGTGWNEMVVTVLSDPNPSVVL